MFLYLYCNFIMPPKTSKTCKTKLNFKSNSHALNLHACIIYIRVNILPVCIFVHANANTHGSKFTYV